MHVFIKRFFNAIKSRNHIVFFYLYAQEFYYHKIHRTICLYLPFRKTIDLLRKVNMEPFRVIFRGLSYEEIVHGVWAVSFIGRYAGWVQ
jgi:hypothetical protein